VKDKPARDDSRRSAPFTVLGDPAPTEHPRVLVHVLTGFLDAGAAPTVAVDHLLDQLPQRTLATFESDDFIDYRARRPLMTYLRDHYDSVAMPEVTLRELTDEGGRPFLLLTGPEPDFAWNRFVRSVIDLVEQWDVSLVSSIGAIPWPAPHTRPLDVTAHATAPELVAAHRSWVDALQIPGHLPGLLELRLGQAGHPAFGYAVHVPQYLAQYRYPRAAIRLLQVLAEGTGLQLPIQGLEEGASGVDAEIAEYLAGSEELRELVAALEVRYDAVHNPPGGTDWDPQDLPSGDEIAEALQAYLADQPGPDDSR
jgi:predicted ATP-grasp superfamily ATP-dependent carboligase